MKTNLIPNFGFKESLSEVASYRTKGLRRGLLKQRIVFGLHEHQDFITSKTMKIGGRILDPEKDRFLVINDKDRVIKKTLFGEKVTHIKVQIGDKEAILSIKSLKKRTGLKKNELKSLSSNEILERIQAKVTEELTSAIEIRSEERKKSLLRYKHQAPNSLSDDQKTHLKEFSGDKNFILEMANVKKGGNLLFLDEAHADLKRNKEFLLEALSLKPSFPIPKELKDDEDLGEVLLSKAIEDKKNLKYLSDLSPHLASNLRFKYLEKNGVDIKKISIENAKKAIRINPYILEDLSEGIIDAIKSSVNTDPTIIRNPYLFQYGPKEWLIEHLNDKVLPALRQNPDIETEEFTKLVKNLTKRLEKEITRDQALKICKTNPIAFKLYMGDYNSVLDTFVHNESEFEFQFKIDRAFVNKVIAANPAFERYVNPTFFTAL